MEKEFIPYKLAVKLKLLGFDEPCLGRWLVITEWEKPTGEVRLQIGSKVEDYNKLQCAAPLYQQAFRWFDHSTEWSGFIVPSKEEGCFEWWIQNYEDPNYLTIESDDWYREREEAELVCLTKLIEIVESKSE